MTTCISAVENVLQLLIVHAYSHVCNADFHISISYRGAHHHTATLGGKLAGIVGHGVNHEKRQRTVGLHHCLGGLYNQFHALHVEIHLALLHNVEQGLQRKTRNTEIKSSLPHLDPPGKHLVVLVDFGSQL